MSRRHRSGRTHAENASGAPRRDDRHAGGHTRRRRSARLLGVLLRPTPGLKAWAARLAEQPASPLRHEPTPNRANLSDGLCRKVFDDVEPVVSAPVLSPGGTIRTVPVCVQCAPASWLGDVSGIVADGAAGRSTWFRWETGQ
jgi:hypothetical protein